MCVFTQTLEETAVACYIIYMSGLRKRAKILSPDDKSHLRCSISAPSVGEQEPKSLHGDIRQ
jgi:hypothetical protein